MVVEPRDAQWEDRKWDVVVRVQVIHGLLVNVHLEVAQLLVRARAEQHQVCLSNLVVVDLRVNVLVLVDRNVGILLVGAVIHDVARRQHRRCLLVIVLLICLILCRAPLACRLATLAAAARCGSHCRLCGCLASHHLMEPRFRRRDACRRSTPHPGDRRDHWPAARQSTTRERPAPTD